MHVKLLVYIYSLCKNLKVKFSLYAPWSYRDSGGVAPVIFYLDTMWRWVARFTPRRLYHRGETAPSTSYTGAWVSCRTGLDVLEKSVFLLSGFEPRGVQPVSHLLYGLRYRTSKFCTVSYWNRLHWNIPHLSLSAVRRTPTLTTLLCNNYNNNNRVRCSSFFL